MKHRGSFAFTFSLKGKGKVIPVLFLTDHYAIKAYWGVKV
jgi:hypothetical protein